MNPVNDRQTTAAIEMLGAWERMAAEAARHELEHERFMAGLTASPWERLSATCVEVRTSYAYDVEV